MDILNQIEKEIEEANIEIHKSELIELQLELKRTGEKTSKLPVNIYRSCDCPGPKVQIGKEQTVSDEFLIRQGFQIHNKAWCRTEDDCQECYDYEEEF